MQCWSGDGGQTQVSILRPDHYASTEEPVLLVLSPNVHQLADGMLHSSTTHGLGDWVSSPLHLLWLGR